MLRCLKSFQLLVVELLTMLLPFDVQLLPLFDFLLMHLLTQKFHILRQRQNLYFKKRYTKKIGELNDNSLLQMNENNSH